MVVSPDHVGHAHVVIVDDDGQHVGRRAVRAHQDQVVHGLGRPGDRALHLVLDGDRAFARCLQANGIFTVGMIRAVAPRRAEQRRFLLGPCLLAEGVDLLPGREALVGGTCFQHLTRDFCVPLDTAELADGFTVPVQAQPLQPFEDRLGRLGRRTPAVRILDSQDELAAVMPGEQPVEQRRARAADVQVAGRRWRETCHNLGHR